MPDLRGRRRSNYIEKQDQVICRIETGLKRSTPVNYIDATKVKVVRKILKEVHGITLPDQLNDQAYWDQLISNECEKGPENVPSFELSAKYKKNPKACSNLEKYEILTMLSCVGQCANGHLCQCYTTSEGDLACYGA